MKYKIPPFLLIISSKLIENYLQGENGAAIIEFLTNLAVCQNVVPDPDENGEIIYKAQSPDEAALCDGARKNGFAFTTRTQTEVTVDVRGEKQTFQVLNVLGFSSKRARMTVVVRHPDGTIRAYSKGSDAKMVPLLSDSIYFFFPFFFLPENIYRRN